MRRSEPWKSLGWRHDLWDLVRYYYSIRGDVNRREWLLKLGGTGTMDLFEAGTLPIAGEDVELLKQYLQIRQEQLESALASLRTETEALRYCRSQAMQVGVTPTQSTDHHQASKALVATVAYVAEKVTAPLGIDLNADPQTRCVWLHCNRLHVTARNLDGAIPSLTNPAIVWEIKEYWGKTKGGSKMSDAVYECNLVGRELREYEERAGVSVVHAVFVDGREQWNARKSDLARFIDLLNQGLIDYLFVGREVEEDWETVLQTHLKDFEW